jgi:hypothetical protein
MMKYNLSFSGKHYEILKQHLFPGDGNEAVAVALCGRYKSMDQTKFLVHKLIPIPYENCKIRESDLITWSTEIIIPYLIEASKKGLAILKIHSHPTGYRFFSATDTKSDLELFESVFGWMDDEEPHVSAIMLPNGEISGRVFMPNLKSYIIDKISIIGDDLIFFGKKDIRNIDEFEKRTEQAFGSGTTRKMKQLKIAVVGCSGTGSPVIEQLARLGVGHIVLVDPDKIEEKNLNRILNSSMADARNSSLKVDVISRAIKRMGIGTKITSISKNIFDCDDCIKTLAGCDFIFGCVDSVDGRHLLNQIATFYLVPYIDVGVKLISDGKGGIDQIMGSVHYLQPGGSSLRTRGVYNEEELRAASIYRVNIKEYAEQKRSGYIVDIVIDSPAVISVNMQIASMAVNEFLARIHPYRYNPNSDFAITRISYNDSYLQNEGDGNPDSYLTKFVGRGTMRPMLNMPELI